jgi:hypothetical protein
VDASGQTGTYDQPDLSVREPEVVAEPEPAAYAPAPVAVTPPPRRKRGRVVAPAGPPRHPDSAGLENPPSDR